MAKEVVIILRNGPEQNRSVLSHYSMEQNHMHGWVHKLIWPLSDLVSCLYLKLVSKVYVNSI